jgi:hypothetical protein
MRKKTFMPQKDEVNEQSKILHKEELDLLVERIVNEQNRQEFGRGRSSPLQGIITHSLVETKDGQLQARIEETATARRTTTTPTPWSKVLHKMTVAQLDKKFPGFFFMKYECSLPSSQEPETGNYPKSDESSSYTRTLFP